MKFFRVIFSLSLSLLATSAAAESVLPKEVGQSLKALMDQGALSEHLPSGWQLERIDIFPQRIEARLKIGDESAGVDLLPPSAAAEVQGRWFVIRVIGPDRDSAKWVALVELGRRLDGHFKENPWKNVGIASGKAVESVNRVAGMLSAESVEGASTAYFVAVGALQWIVLLLAFLWIFLRFTEA